MWKLHRYYLKEVATSSVITFTVLFGIVLVSVIYRGVSRAQGFGVVAAAEVTFFWAADTLPHLLPISLLFGTVLVFARASQDRELTAVRAAGISPRVVMTPALLVGLAFSAVDGWAMHYVVPHAHYAKYRVVAEGIRTLLDRTGLMTDRVTFRGLVMVWQDRTDVGHWRNVVARVRRGGPELGPLSGMDVVLADEAWVELEGQERLTLVLKGGRSGDGRLVLPEETRLSVSIRAIADSGLRVENDRDLETDQLLSEVYRGVHQNPLGARYTVHRRSCFSLLPAILAPIGFVIGVMSRARGRVLALVFAMVPLLIFYFSDVVAASLARATDWPPIAWLPACVLIVLAAPFCWRWLRF